MEVNESKIKILDLEMPEGANNDIDEELTDDLTDPHTALGQIKFDDFIQQENALKSINELSLKEKSTKTSKNRKKDENGLKSKSKKKKTKDEDSKEHKKSKKSRKVKEQTDKENSIGN